MTSTSLLDLQGNTLKSLNKDDVEAYTKILENPDVLGRLFRLFTYQNTNGGTWKPRLLEYISVNEERGKSWCNDIRTNLTRTLYESESVSWGKFLEGLVVLEPMFDTLKVEVFTDLTNGEPAVVRIRPRSAFIEASVKIEPLPSGGELIPKSYYRSPLEPFPVKVMRDALRNIQSPTDFREVARANLASTVTPAKLNGLVNSLYISCLKPTVPWKRMMTVLFATGANSIIIKIVGFRKDKKYQTMVMVKK